VSKNKVGKEIHGKCMADLQMQPYNSTDTASSQVWDVARWAHTRIQPTWSEVFRKGNTQWFIGAYSGHGVV
jgi:hypothetical protein